MAFSKEQLKSRIPRSQSYVRHRKICAPCAAEAVRGASFSQEAISLVHEVTPSKQEGIGIGFIHFHGPVFSATSLSRAKNRFRIKVPPHTMKRLDTLLPGGGPCRQGAGATGSVGRVHCNRPFCFQDPARHHSVTWVVRKDISRFSVAAESRSDFEFLLPQSTSVSDFEVHASRG